MGKVKIKKKDTRIDMTAMSDVTVLLLTFFMLTSTFLTKEPAQVTIPPSVSEKKVPQEKAVQILVSQQGQVYFTLMGGTIDNEGTKETLATENMRAEVLEYALKIYKDEQGKVVNLTPEQKKKFALASSFGVPMRELSGWLKLDQKSMDAYLQKKGLSLPDDNVDFQVWMKAVKQVAQAHGFGKDLIGGQAVAIKADRSTPYKYVEGVTANLQELQISKFSLMTALTEKEG
ncbi:MAG: biopolymer transporter ExbD [Muribaculaceae bacterium]|nr:biopolymer transporter ExbD [Muribaculaceae bacterium]